MVVWRKKAKTTNYTLQIWHSKRESNRGGLRGVRSVPELRPVSEQQITRLPRSVRGTLLYNVLAPNRSCVQKHKHMTLQLRAF